MMQTIESELQQIENLRSLPCERAIISSLLTYQDIANDLSLILTGKMFYDRIHGDIFDKCIQLEKQGETVNAETVCSGLSLDIQVKDSKGNRSIHFEAIFDITKELYGTPEFLKLAYIVREKYKAREYHSLCQQAASRFGAQPFAQAKEWFERSITELQVTGASEHTRKMSDVMLEEFNNLAAINQNQGEEATLILPTGFKYLDEKLGGGMPNERLITILGATGMGKTTLLLEILFSSAYIYRQPTLFFSLEMGANSQAQKLFSKHAKISTQHLQAGRISEAQWEAIYQTSVDYRPVPLEINDRVRTIDEIVSISRAFYAKHGSIGAIAVDFLTLVKASGKGDDRHTPNHVLQELNQLKKELNTRVYVLCQIGRAVKDRQDKRPKIEDAKETGMVEELSDIVLSCYRDEYYFPDTNARGTMELCMLKSRYTSLDTFKLIFDGATSSIYDTKNYAI